MNQFHTCISNGNDENAFIWISSDFLVKLCRNSKRGFIWYRFRFSYIFSSAIFQNIYHNRNIHIELSSFHIFVLFVCFFISRFLSLALMTEKRTSFIHIFSAFLTYIRFISFMLFLVRYKIHTNTRNHIKRFGFYLILRLICNSSLLW